MQTINVGNKRLIAVTVPEDAKVDNFEHVYAELFYWQDEGLKHICEIGYDSQIIGLAKSMTEEQWAGIVQAPDWFWMEWYFMNYVEEEFNCQTATESGLSLLQKHGVDPENTLIIEII